MTAKYGKTIVLDFKIYNNTGAAISDYDFIFNWNHVSNAIMWSGMDVIQNGDNGIVQLKKTAWGNPLPIGTSTFSITMDYEPGMFPPAEGALNGSVIRGITCYTPPAHENFECERDFSDVCTIKPIGPGGHEIKIGQGSVFAWKAPIQVYIPENKKSWAIAMAVSHSLFTNLMGFDVMSINEYFATAIQESNAGCEGSRLIAPNWVTATYPHHDTNNPIFCYDATGAVAVGYFQQEMGGSWTELDANYPCFIPKVKRDDFISDPNAGSNFEFQSIVKAYHDYRNVAFWQYVKCWNPIGFFKTAKDPYAAVKMIGMAYNQGMNHASFEEVFSANRTDAINADNLMDKITPGTPTATNRLYAEQINRLTKVLDDRVADIDWNDAAVFGVTDRGAHTFRDFYDAQFRWSDVEEYIKKITPFYTDFGVTEADFRAAIKPVFDNINGGNPISFRYQMSAVIEAIVVYLPAFDPKKGLAEYYGGAGANNCFAPTARMEGHNAACGEDLSLTVYFSGEAPYTFTYKRTDVDPEAIFPDITTSQNPYIIKAVDEGTYALIAVRDNVSAGEVVCSPIDVRYIGAVARAKLIKDDGDFCAGRGQSLQVEITSNEQGPFVLEYTIDGILQAPLTIAQKLYDLVPAPAAAGTYKLTKISVDRCDALLDETEVIDGNAAVPSLAAALSTQGEDACQGIRGGVWLEIASSAPGPYTVEYEIDGVLQAPVAVNASPFELAAAPAAKGTYRLAKISAGGCDFPLNEELVVDDAAAPSLAAALSKQGEDACQGIRGGVWLEIASSVPGPYTVEYEIDGVLQAPATANASPFELAAAPAAKGTYRLAKISAGGCDFPLNEELVVDDVAAPSLAAALSTQGEDACQGMRGGVWLEIASSVPGPYTVEYEIDGVLQAPVAVNASPFELAAAPAAKGTYRLAKISAGGCDFPLNEELVVDDVAAPSLAAALSTQGEDACQGMRGGVWLEIASSVPGPYTVEYEIDGVLQAPVAVNASPFELVAAPAAKGTYRLAKISAGGCDFPLNEELVVADVAAPSLAAALSKQDEDACQGIRGGVWLEIASSAPGPYTVEYEIDGVLQAPVAVNASPFELAAAPAAKGTYRLAKISAGGCDFPLNEELVVDDVAAPSLAAALSKQGEDACQGIRGGVWLEIASSAPGPYKVEYEIDGVLQAPVAVNASPFELAAAPAAKGTYRLAKISAGGCDFPLNEELVVDDAAAPSLAARLVEIKGVPCLIASEIEVQIDSNAAGPYAIEYEIDGIAQPIVITNEVFYTLIIAPQKGSYKLTKITAGNCEFLLNEKLDIDGSGVPSVNAKLFKYGGVSCLNNPGIRVEISSNLSGPYFVEYEFNGMPQAPVTTSLGSFVLVSSPALAGTYKLVKITVNYCEFLMDDTLVIDENSAVLKVSIKGISDICKGQTAVLKAVAAPETAEIESYQWRKDNADIPGAVMETYLVSEAGNYLVEIRDSNGCSSVSPIARVSISPDSECGPKPESDYPKFFTPNGDGHNDRWHITNFEKFHKAEINIFDRYGKFIIRIAQQTEGWDGTYNGGPLFASDYWFVIIYEDKATPGVKKQYRGHFSLKR